MTATELDIALIRTDGGTQPRALIDLEAAEKYADEMQGGDEFPPVVVFYDGTDHWLADGFHRHAACKLLDRTTIAADIRPGTRRDAILYACGANATNGIARTNADKRRAVRVLLEDPEWVQWPQTRIAEVCHVSREFVNRMATMLQPVIRSQDTVRVVSRDGAVYHLDTAKAARREPTEPRPGRDIIGAAVVKHRAEDRDEKPAAAEARRAVERILTAGMDYELPPASEAAMSLPDAFVSEGILEQLERLIEWLTTLADGLTDRLQGKEEENRNAARGAVR